MSDPLTASDFWPLILKLPHDERCPAGQARSASGRYRRLLGGGLHRGSAYPDEFSSDDEPLAWESQGWEEFGAPR